MYYFSESIVFCISRDFRKIAIDAFQTVVRFVYVIISSDLSKITILPFSESRDFRMCFDISDDRDLPFFRQLQVSCFRKRCKMKVVFFVVIWNLRRIRISPFGEVMIFVFVRNIQKNTFLPF